MERLRISALDNVCEAIAEIRGEKNELIQREGEQMNIGLKEMRKNGKTTWRHAGVELVRVPGEEKLRVRTTKSQATAEVEEPPAPNGDGTAAEPMDDEVGADEE